MNTTTQQHATEVTSAIEVQRHSLNELFGNATSQVLLDWHTLLTTASMPSLLHHPEYVQIEMEKCPEADGRLLTAYRGTTLLGVAILLPKVINTRTVGTIGWHSKIRGYRLQGDDFLTADRDAFEPLFNSVRDMLADGTIAVVLIEEQRESSPLHEIISSATSGVDVFSPNGFSDHWIIDFTSGVDGWFEANFTSKQRQRLRYKNRKLGGELRRFSDVEEIATFVEDAKTVSETTWQSQQFGLRVTGSDNELKRYTFQASNGLMRCYVLYLEERPIAFVIGNEFRGRFRYEEVGYDPEYGRLSPGNVLIYQMIEEMLENGVPDYFDFGFGTADYKEFFSNHSDRSRTVWLLPPALGSKLLTKRVAACHSARSFAKACLGKLGIRNRVRNLLRRLRRN